MFTLKLSKTVLLLAAFTINIFTIPSAMLDMQPRTRKNEAGVDSC